MRRQALNRPVPHFALFGEAPTLDPGPSLHVEPIRRRSRPRGWEISDHAHDGLLQAVVLRRGWVEPRLDGRATLLRAPVVLCVPPGVVHAFRFDPGVDGDVVSIGEALLGSADRESLAAYASPLHAMPLVLRPNPAAMVQLGQLLAVARAETDAARPGRALMLAWLARCLILWLYRTRQTGATAGARLGRQASRLLQFRQLVERHFRERRDVAFYAGRLGVTERTLRRICHAAEGVSPGRLVEARIALEARRRLLYTHETMASIAYDLGFDDPAYFSRFVRRLTGATPTALRRSAG